jgi:uracil-DNA glycosylase
MADSVPESWKAALEPVLNASESRRLGGWLRQQ